MPPTDLADLVDQILARPAPLPIVTAGDPVLRRPAAAYDGQLESDVLRRLVDAMRTTMRDAPGVGLAAPQIGIPLRLAVIEDRPEYGELITPQMRQARERTPQEFRVLINPRYEPIGSERVEFYEGCLSVPGWQAVTARYRRIRLHCQDESGRDLADELVGWGARIAQHETDHLDGTLYLDRAEIRSLASNDQVRERWSQPTVAEAARALHFPLGG